MRLPSSYQELERVYQSLTLAASSCIAVTSAEPGEGVSLLVDALARRAARGGKRVVIVDLNLFHPRTFSTGEASGRWEPGSAPLPTPQGEKNISVVRAPLERQSQLALRESGALEQFIEGWKLEYDLVLLDCAAINLNNQSNLPATRALIAADGVLISYLAGVTAGVKLKQACDEIQNQQAALLGVIINDKCNPPLRSELLRSLPKMLRWLPGISPWLSGKVANSQLLSIKI